MKYILKLVLAAGLFTSSVTGVLSAQELKKVGSVDSAEVMSLYWKVQKLNKELAIEQDAIKSEDKEKMKQIEKLNEEVKTLAKQLRDPNLVRKKLEELKLTYERKINQLSSSDKMRREYVEAKFKALNLHKNQKSQQLIGEVKAVIVKYASENGYDAIYDTINLIYLKEDYNLTTKIVELINADKPVEEVAPLVPKAPETVIPAPAVTPEVK